MISVFRKFAKSPLALIIIAPLFLGLAIFGFGDPLSNFGGGSSVVKAGDRSISQPEFRLMFDRRLDQVRERNPGVTQAEAVAQGFHMQLLEALRGETGFYAWAWKAGIRPGKALILDQISRVPAFFNQVTGAFDQAQYAQVLAQENLTEAMFEENLRDTFAATHFSAALYAGMRVPRIYGALIANQGMEARDGRWFVVTQAMAGETPAPTEAQLTAFLSENAAQLRRPEFRGVAVALFGPAPGSPPPAISDEAIRERFEFRAASLSQPETRSFVTLTTRDQAAAGRIAAALSAGQAPAEVASANSTQPVEYNNRPRTAVTDTAVAAAAFGLAANQVSDPVQGGLGWTVIQMRSIQPGRAATLESARDAIVEELRAEAVRGATYEMVEAYEAARQNGSDMAAAARAAGARIVDLPPFTEEGRLPDGQPLPGPPQIVSTAYELERGGESDVIDAGQGQYFALRVNQVTPAALPELDQVRAPLTQAWTQRENARRLAAKAEELAARVRGGEAIEAVAASVSAPMVVETGVQQNEQTQTALGAGVLQGLFGQSRGQAFSVPMGPGGHAVGRVEAIRAPAAAIAAPIAEQLRPRVSMQLIEEMSASARDAAAEAVKARSNPRNARLALGLPADEEAPVAPAQ
jgi:peptidyl-prolyl cis-trans isomerase D